MKKIVLIVLILTLCLCSCEQEPESAGDIEPVSRQVFAMDTYMTLTAYGENADEALKACEEEIHRIDALLSTGNKDSEISRINREKDAVVSEETFDLIENALGTCEESGGVFDISVYPVMKAWGFTDEKYRVPSGAELKKLLTHVDYSQIRLEEGNQVCLQDPEMEIDLGGIAKGYTSDRVVQVLKDYGIEHAVVNLGGNVQTLGNKPDGSLWKIGILDPQNEDEFLGGISGRDQAVVTSGGYQRFFEKDGEIYFHIIDLKDGFPARNGLISATVISEDGTLADALSTTLFILGPKKAGDYWRNHADQFQAVLMEDDGTILITEGLEDTFESDAPFEVIRQ